MRARRLTSSLIERVVFDDEAETLTVAFRSRRKYLYSGVPRALYDAFVKAQSAGSFFNERIKGQFPCHDLSTRKRYPLPELA